MRRKRAVAGDEAREPGGGEAGAGGPRRFGPATGEEDGDDAEQSGDRAPVDEGPSDGLDEVSEAVHVGEGVLRGGAEEVEGIFPAEVEEDGLNDEGADNNGVADEFIGDEGLDEERQEGVDHHLGEGDEEELLDVLEEVVVVEAGDGLHEDAADHAGGENHEGDEGEGGEFGEPVRGFAQGECVVDAIEVGVALAPEELGGVEGDDDIAEEGGVAFDDAEDEIGDGVDADFGAVAGEVAVGDREAGVEREDAPEGDLVEDVGDADAGEGGELGPRSAAVEDLVDEGKAGDGEGTHGASGGDLLLACSGCAAALGASGEGLDGHGEEGPDGGEAEAAEAYPEEAVVEERAGPGEEEGVLFGDGPVAGDGAGGEEADGVEDDGPEVLERAGGGKDGEADDVEHEQGDALEVDDEDFAGKGGDGEEEGAEKEGLDDDDGEEGLEVPGEGSVGGDAGVIGPGGEGAEGGAEEEAGEGEDGRDEGSGPASAEVGEFGDGLGEEDLKGVALKVAKDGRAEDGGDDNGAEPDGADVVVGVRVWAVEKDFAV